MRVFALSAFCDPQFIGKDPDEICLGIGLGKHSYKNFCQFNPHFDEWLESTRAMLGGKNKKALLEYVGMEKALEGDFSFWKLMAQREGVISADTLNIGVNIPSSLGEFEGMDDDKLKALENTIMATLRGAPVNGPLTLSEGPDGWQRQSDPPRTPPLPEGPVVLADELGTDGERPLYDLDTF